ncbi:MAG: LacI family DNA-binding transcriptional regulator [Hyphomicrobiales bacterium]|nr:LacI family DNA-binding transcriptional regulator [Hyphomicrobiales bacterium]
MLCEIQPYRSCAVTVTLAEVAKRARVGTGTVSRVLNGARNVSPSTRDRVQACIREMGYRPNLVARGLAASRTGMVCALIPAIGAPQHGEVIQGLGDVLHEHGIQLMIGDCGYQPDREEAIVADFLERRPDAFYLTGVVHNAKTRQMLRASGIPIVEGANLTDDPIDCVVGYSNFAAARALAQLMHRRGHRTMAFVASTSDPNDRIGDRLKGYLAACAELGQDTRGLVLESANNFNGGAAALDIVLHHAAPIDLLLCATDVLAVGAIFECQRRGIAVPGRLAIAGFDDLPLAAAISPGLTTVSVDRIAMGRVAGHMLLQRLAGRQSPYTKIDVGFTIRERASTGAGIAP